MRLIFTITPGRSGTGLLAYLMDSIPGVVGRHEPEPDFASCMRQAQSFPDTFKWFWKHKLAAIEASLAEAGCDTYCETSHLACKGFLSALKESGQEFDVIILTRPAREVAQSLYQLNTVPYRTAKGRKYLLQPDDPGVLPIKWDSNWHSMHDYQLCYWYCLEIERRAEKWIHDGFHNDHPPVVTSLEHLISGECINIQERLGLHDFTAKPKLINDKTDRKRPLPDLDYDALEAEVLTACE